MAFIPPWTNKRPCNVEVMDDVCTCPVFPPVVIFNEFFPGVNPS